MTIFGCAIFGVLIWLWFDQESARQTSLPTASSARADVSGKAYDRNSSVVAVLPNMQSGTAQGSSRPWQSVPGENSIGLFDESATSLIRSGKLAKIDYGLFNGRTWCLSLPYSGDGAKALKDIAPRGPVSKADALSLGTANEAMRLVGFQRSSERCRKLYAGVQFTEEERVANGALPSVAQYRAILNTLGNAKDFNNPETMAALSEAVSGPMFGALSSLISTKVDYRELVDAYGPEQAIPLYAFVVPLILCRMGDDCGPRGIVTEQLCWLNSICGDYAEDGIWSTLRGHGLDTGAMEKFVARVHSGLVNRDPSIFKKPK